MKNAPKCRIWNGVEYIGKFSIGMTIPSTDFTNIKDLEYELYSEIKDCNNTEIYENDIVCFSSDKEEYPLGIVKYGHFIIEQDIDNLRVKGWYISHHDGSRDMPLHGGNIMMYFGNKLKVLGSSRKPIINK